MPEISEKVDYMPPMWTLYPIQNLPTLGSDEEAGTSRGWGKMGMLPRDPATFGGPHRR